MVVIANIPVGDQIHLMDQEEMKDILQLAFGAHGVKYEEDCSALLIAELEKGKKKVLDQIKHIATQRRQTADNLHSTNKRTMESMLDTMFRLTRITDLTTKQEWMEENNDYSEEDQLDMGTPYGFGIQTPLNTYWKKKIGLKEGILRWDGCRVIRWCCGPYEQKWIPDREGTIKKIGDALVPRDLKSTPSYLPILKKRSILSDNQWDEQEHEPNPTCWFNEYEHLPNPRHNAPGLDPRRRYLREQYSMISEDYELLTELWLGQIPPNLFGDEREDWVKQKVADWSVKAGLWTLMPGSAAGRTKFVKNQSDIKYYKDYLKVQLSLTITPFKNAEDRFKVNSLTQEGKYYFAKVFRQGWRNSRWRKYGIGEVENYNCSLLNYIGRSAIFQQDGGGFLHINDGQYLIR